MKAFLTAAIALVVLEAVAASSGTAQGVANLDVNIHGYATQGFLYTNHNSWNTTDSENTSAAWSDVVVNLSAQPDPKLRFGIQARYFLLGDYGNQFSLDWAQADYKFNEHIGVRVGKVKTPMGLLNESQDIDPAQLWVLLPQSIYPIASRDSILAHYGGVLYGSLPLGGSMGKLEYRAFAGERVVRGNDGYFQPLRDTGFTLPNGINGNTAGGTLRWVLPVRGLAVGASENSGIPSGEIDAGASAGMLTVKQFRETFFFTQFERKRLMLAAEYSIFLAQTNIQVTGLPLIIDHADQRPWYVMASYKLTPKLTGGLYYSSYIDYRQPLESARYQKDWNVAARYDFNDFLYAKLEQHWMDGTALGFSTSDNPNLQPTTRMTLVKLGVSF